MNPHFWRDILAPVLAAFLLAVASFLVAIAVRHTTIGEIAPGGASPNRPPYSATTPQA